MMTEPSAWSLSRLSRGGTGHSALLRRQREAKLGAAAFDIRGGNHAAMGFNDRSRNRQPHSQSSRLGREELFEETLAHVLGYADAMIAYGGFNLSGGIRSGCDHHNALGRRHITHGIECIDEEIEQNLLDLDRISGKRRQAGAKLTPDSARTLRCLRPDHVHEHPYEVVQIDRLTGWRISFHHSADVVNDLTGAAPVGTDIRE